MRCLLCCFGCRLCWCGGPRDADVASNAEVEAGAHLLQNFHRSVTAITAMVIAAIRILPAVLRRPLEMETLVRPGVAAGGVVAGGRITCLQTPNDYAMVGKYY